MGGCRYPSSVSTPLYDQGSRKRRTWVYGYKTMLSSTNAPYVVTETGRNPCVRSYLRGTQTVNGAEDGYQVRTHGSSPSFAPREEGGSPYGS